MRFRTVLAGLAMAPLLIAASEPVRLKPASKWVLNYGENSCRLGRNFGDPSEPTVLILERASPNSSLSMVAIGKSLKAPAGAAEVTVRFLPVEGLHFESGQPAKSANGKDPAVLWPYVGFIPVLDQEGPSTEETKKAMEAIKRGERPPPRDLAKMSELRAEIDANATNVTSIEIEGRRNKPVVLVTGSLGKPIRMLYECSRHQLRYWGLDPDIEDKIVRPPWAKSPQEWFSSDDYPKSGLEKNQESVVQARLLVDATGKVTKCTALTHVDAPEFQKVVCDKFTKRGRFHPAELADGTKVPSYYVQTTRFILGH